MPKSRRLEDDDLLLIIDDLAEILQKSVNGVRKMRALGHLPEGIRIGNRLYWVRSKFRAWIDEQADAAAGFSSRNEVIKWLKTEYPTGFRKMVAADAFPPSIVIKNEARWGRNAVTAWMNSNGYR
jgi:predicted DNA-binding transcriptional regulator AlpA